MPKSIRDMSKFYIILLIIASLSIATIGAVFSVFGLTKLFAGAAISVAVMATALEFSKLVTAGFLYRYWGHVNNLMRIYLSCAVVALSAITSLGIFGFLSNAYQTSSISLKVEQLKLNALKLDKLQTEAEILRIHALIANVPKSRITKKLALQDSYEPRIRELEEKTSEILDSVRDANLKIADTQIKVGPLSYVAETIHTDVDSVAKILISLFVSIFDPLAICLVFATHLAIRLREKYSGNENRIAALSFANPVDHRFKKKKKSA
jgi:hypothetical protein